MKKLMLLLLSFCLISTIGFAQTEEEQPKEETKRVSKKEQTIFNQKNFRFTGAWGTSTTSLTFFKDDFAVITGGYGGLEFGKDVFIGWGGYKMQNDFKIDRFQNDRFELDYNGFIVGYSPNSFRVLHPKFMLLTGGGKLRLQEQGSDHVFVIQPSAGIEINVLRWFRIGLDGGYRFVADTDFTNLSDADVSAPYGELTFKFGWSWGKS